MRVANLPVFILNIGIFILMNTILPFLFTLLAAVALQAQQTFPLYQDNIPNSIPSPDKERSERNGLLRISNVSRPTLTAFLPPAEKANGTAVIICPGGGYAILAIEHEGTEVARAFNEIGVTAFVLKYRLPNDSTMVDKTIGPLQDAQQAMKRVREEATKWKIHPDRIGIMGFSAGGHLAATAGTHFMKPVLSGTSSADVRPDFMVLIYPVISFSDQIGHIGSRNRLLGKSPSSAQIEAYSADLQVSAETPPTFLLHASDDKGVKPANSIRMYEALLEHGVKAEMHIYQQGGHGFGLKVRSEDEKWMERCRNWMKTNGWLEKD